MSFAIGSGSLTSVIAQWASEHAASMGDELRGLMKAADHRAQLLKELNELKTAIGHACLDPKLFTQALEQLNAFIKRHPQYQEALGPMVPAFEYEVGKHPAKTDGNAQNTNGIDSDDDLLEQLDGSSGDDDQAGTGTDANELNILQGLIGPNGTWGIALDGAIDDLRNQDRMGMIEIQDLVDKLKQAEMLGSNLIRSINDAAESVIGNIA